MPETPAISDYTQVSFLHTYRRGKKKVPICNALIGVKITQRYQNYRNAQKRRKCIDMYGFCIIMVL